jgi:zinc D-Ala-D-Ala carboxypeptidase
MTKISKFFSNKEFRCPKSGLLFVDPDLLEMLDNLRDLMGEPVYVTSGCRSREHNKAIGGAESSLHITDNENPCRAADLRRGNGNYQHRLLGYIFELGFGGVGVYVGHTHVDIRNVPTVW